MDTISTLKKDIENLSFSENTVVIIEDVTFNDDETKDVSIVVSPNHSVEDINNLVEVRKTLSTKTVRSDREKKSLDNAIGSLAKITDYEGLIKKLKTLMKFSSDIDFPYLDVAKKISEMPFYEDYHYAGETLTDETLQKLIVSQTVYSLEHYGIIHPKIKLLINLIGKLDSIDGQPEDGSLEFKV